MDDPKLMHMIDTKENLSNEINCLLLFQAFEFSNTSKKLTTFDSRIKVAKKGLVVTEEKCNKNGALGLILQLHFHTVH